jgi:hypothetical protein
MDLINQAVSTTALSNRSNRAKTDTASTFIGDGEFLSNPLVACRPNAPGMRRGFISEK